MGLKIFDRMDRVAILEDTLKILSDGYYEKCGERISLKLSEAEMKSVRVFLPEEIAALREYEFSSAHFNFGKVKVSCKNTDSFAIARERHENGCEDEKLLILNFANPVNPGGGVKRGARAQEEDLCRVSSLLLSLESDEAKKYYEYNRSLNTYMGSDAVIITPQVEIIKDQNGKLLDDTIIVSIMTCAAPMLNYGMEGLSEQEYEDMFCNRIVGMLRCAAVMGYDRLVLGAFGCGAFKNDAKVVSDLFYRALREFKLDGKGTDELFEEIAFSVLDRSEDKYNLNEFCRNFADDNYYREEKAQKEKIRRERYAEREQYLDKICGSLLGGAAGDALGYPIEFMSRESIVEAFGDDGICEYSLIDGCAKISDDTQMTLFTAVGILASEARLGIRRISRSLIAYVSLAYLEWLTTQNELYEVYSKRERRASMSVSWLMEVPELFCCRAPGMTCLSALREMKSEKKVRAFDNPINNSKGCGGVMRVAPLGLRYEAESDEILLGLDRDGASIAAITHGHPLGYIPAAVLTHIINRVVYSGMTELSEIISEALEYAERIFEKSNYLECLKKLLEKAISLSDNDLDDAENIAALGEGWVAEEALAIAFYCANRYKDDFSKGIIAAVNHGGDSDSTGAIAGNIIGAMVGYSAIEDKWKEKLELSEVILEIADDLCFGDLSGNEVDSDWHKKYFNAHKK